MRRVELRGLGRGLPALDEGGQPPPEPSGALPLRRLRSSEAVRPRRRGREPGVDGGTGWGQEVGGQLFAGCHGHDHRLHREVQLVQDLQMLGVHVSDFLFEPHGADLLVEVLLKARGGAAPVDGRPRARPRRLLFVVLIIIGVVVLLGREGRRRREPQVGASPGGARHHVHAALSPIHEAFLPKTNGTSFRQSLLLQSTATEEIFPSSRDVGRYII